MSKCFDYNHYMGKKERKRSGLMPKTSRVLEMAVNQGIDLGWNRAHKYSIDSPDRESIKKAIADAIMLSIDEWFRFDEEE